MKKKIVFPIILISITFVCFLTASVISRNIEVPTFIKTAEDLNKIRNNLNGSYVISNNINISDLKKSAGYDGWVPIGTKEKPFTGKIDFRNKTIANLEFSTSYIEKQFAQKENYEVAVGFFGYSKGTILNANFYKPLLPDLDKGDKQTIFGLVCAVNDGTISSSQITFVSNASRLIGKNIICGSVVGLNNKDVVVAKSTNTFYVTIRNSQESICGGIIGKTTQSSLNSYLFKGGFIDLHSGTAHSVIFGSIVGEAEGGTFDNCYVGSNKDNDEEYTMNINPTDYEPKSFYCGGLIGRIEQNAVVNISDCYIRTIFKINFIKSDIDLFVAGLIGYSLSSKVTINNALIDSEFKIDYLKSNETVKNRALYCSSNNTSCTVNNNVASKRVKHYKDGDEPDDFLDGITNKKKEEISLIDCSTMKWNKSTEKGEWKKSRFDKGERFFLTILK